MTGVWEAAAVAGWGAEVDGGSEVGEVDGGGEAGW
jgi:hypothetical protein